MFEQLTDWLSHTQANAFLSDTTNMWTWLIVPISQSVHILSVAIVMISVAMLNLRLLGIGGTRQSFAKLASQLMPWVWGALVTLLLTGVIQTIAEPSRELLNWTFRIKMLLLLTVIGITFFYRQAIKSDARFWEWHRHTGQFLASLSMVLWVGIVAAGRLIAYVG